MAAATGDDINNVTGQAAKGFADTELSGGACDESGGVEMRAGRAVGLVAGMVAGREGRGRGKGSGDKQIPEVLATFVGCERGKRKDVLEFGI